MMHGMNQVIPVTITLTGGIAGKVRVAVAFILRAMIHRMGCKLNRIFTSCE